MKKSTKNLLFAAGTLLSIFFLTSAFVNQDSELNKYLTVRTLEMPTGNSSKIIIVYEDGRTEEFDLDKFGNLENAIKINQAINSVAKQGYELVSSNGGEYSSTFIFIKK